MKDKRMKRLISVILTVCMLAGSLPTSVFAEDTIIIEDTAEELSEDTGGYAGGEAGAMLSTSALPAGDEGEIGGTDELPQDDELIIDDSDSAGLELTDEEPQEEILIDNSMGAASGDEILENDEEEQAAENNMAAVDPVAEVQAMIDALPTEEEIAFMDEQAQNEVYATLQTAYAAYLALDEEQQAQVTGAEIFETLFGWFNGQIMELGAEDTTASLAGDGLSADTAYEIASVQDLFTFASMVNSGTYETYDSKYFKLTADINMTGQSWPSIATSRDKGFCGTLDGANHKISNLNGPLFGYMGYESAVNVTPQITKGGVIKNLTLDGTINSDAGINFSWGAFTCWASYSTIESCVLNATVNLTAPAAVNADTNTGHLQYAGGFVGYGNNTTITNSKNQGNLTASYVGMSGFVGVSYGTIENCINSGNITGVKGTAGICSSMNNEAVIRNCVNTGNVTGSGDVGGIVGHLSCNTTEHPTIERCYNTGTISNVNSDYATGGIVGEAVGSDSDYRAIIRNCYNTGTVQDNGGGEGYIGGIAGIYESNTTTIKSCYNTGIIASQGNFSLYNSYKPALLLSYNKGSFDVSSVYTNGTVIGRNTVKTDAQFASGEVAYLLNTIGETTANSGVWSQDTSAPIFADGTNNAVYRAVFMPAEGTDPVATYYLKTGDPLTKPEAPAGSEWPDTVPAVMPAEDVTYTATTTVGTAVASVTAADGSLLGSYSTLNAAIDAAQGENAGCTVKLLRDADITKRVFVMSTFTLDLNGFTAKNASGVTGYTSVIQVQNGGNLTIQGDADGKGTLLSETTYRMVSIEGTGCLTVKSGAIASPSNTISQEDTGTGKVTLNGGSVTATLEELNTAVYAHNLVITGGTYTGAPAVSISQGLNVQLSGGTFNGTIKQSGAQESNPVAISTLLAPGYAYKAIGGTWVTDADALAASSISNVTVTAEPIQIATQPQSTTVTYGYTTAPTLTVAASGEGTISYQWETKLENSTWGNVEDTYTGGTTANLTLPLGLGVLESGDTYKYRCKLVADGYTRYTNEVTVTVNAADNAITEKTDNPLVKDFYAGNEHTATDLAAHYTATKGAVQGELYKGSYDPENYVAGDKILATDTGTYTLHLYTASTANYNQATKDVTLTVSYYPTDAVASYDPAPNANGWHNTNKPSVQAPDGYTLVLKPFELNEYTCTDKYQLIQNGTNYLTDVKTLTCMVDADVPGTPTLAITAGPTDTTATVTASGSTDATSGVAYYTLTEVNNLIAPITVTDGKFELEKLTPNTAYSFTATATDKADNVSAASSAAGFTTQHSSQAALTVTGTPEKVTYGDTFTLDTQGGSGTGDVTWAVTSGTATVDKTTGKVTITGVGAVEIAATKAQDTTYNAATATTTFTAEKKAITFTFTCNGKTYDGQTYDGQTGTGYSYSLNGLLEQDKDVKKVYATADVNYDNANAGTGKTVTATGITLRGTAADNYTANKTATTTADITPAAVNVTANAQTKTYGEKDPALTYTATGLVGEDTLAGTLTRVAGEDVKMGGYAITQGSLTNENNPNYTITYTPAVLTINAKTLTEAMVSVAGNQVYSGIAKTPVTVADGTLMKATDYGVTYTNNTNAGTAHYTVTAKGNYTGEVEDSFEIAKALLTVTPNANTITYGDTPAANGVSYDGFVGTDSESVLQGTVTYTYSYPRYGKVGDYTITPAGLTAANYAITFKTGVLTVAQCPVTVTVDAKTSVYGAELAALTASVTNGSVVDGDKVYTLATTATTTAAVGEYAITGITSNANYDVSFVNAKYTITKKVITPVISQPVDADYIGSQITPAVTVKDGTTDLATTDYTVSYGENTNVGEATVTVKATENGNYSFADVERKFTINKVDYTGTTTAEATCTYATTGTKTLDLTTLLPAGYVLGEVKVSGTGISSAGIVGTDLNYTLDGTAAADTKAAVTIPVTASTNYTPFDLVLTVSFTAKNVTEISGITAATNLVYTADAQTGYTGTPAFSGGYTGNDLTITYYTGANATGTPMNGKPVNAGDYTVKLAVPETNEQYAGSTTLHFTINKGTALVTGIQLNDTAMTLLLGKEAALKATVKATDDVSYTVNKTVTWKSSDTSVVKVSSSGKLSAVGTGSATITCTAKDGSGKKAACKVTVIKTTTSVALARASAGKTTVTLKWNKINNATGYEIYGAKCGKAMKKLATIKNGSTTTKVIRSLKKGTSYKFIVKSYLTLNGKKVYLKTTDEVHIVTSGGRYTNIKAVKLNFTSATLKAGKTKQIKASVSKVNSSKYAVNHAATFRYATSNSKVAAASKSGRIKAVKKGTCTIYVYANNGVRKTIKVTVK